MHLKVTVDVSRFSAEQLQSFKLVATKDLLEIWLIDASVSEALVIAVSLLSAIQPHSQTTTTTCGGSSVPI